MDLEPVLLSRIRFAFVVSFHIILPVFTIALAAWPIAPGLGVCVMYGPCTAPYSLTVAGAAEASLRFLFWDAGLFVPPVIAVYTIGVDRIFCGKTQQGH